MIKKVLIVGAGGISSHMVHYIRYYADRNQFQDMDLTIIDYDRVEKKNLAYSDFETGDIGEYKAKVLGERFGFKYIMAKLINASQLKDYDVIVLAVDNSQTRDVVYKSDKFWIDCRSKGIGYSIFYKSQKTTNNKLNLKRPAESCQYSQRLDLGIVDCGNVIAAMFGVAQLLNYFRGTLTIPEVVGTI